jgi:RNA polymerase sigma-70 factor (ECF subfamily)
VNELDDRALLQAWADGDVAAGDLLLQRHFASLVRLFHSRMPDRAADLIQRTMLGCVESHRRIPDGVPFRAYLLGIAHRVLVGCWRDDERRARREAALAAFDRTSLTSPSQVVAASQRHRELLGALRQLPLDLQLPLELAYWEDLSNEEIAMVLDVPLGTAKSRLRRAREALVESLRAVEPRPLASLDDLDRWARELRWFLGRTDTRTPA